MLEMICQELNNYFDTNRFFGEFRIEGGKLISSFFTLEDGQYFRIIGSIFNDGVYQNTEDLKFEHDEVFNGAIWAMAVPSAVVALTKEIEEWVEANKKFLESPYQSESFGGYSYSLKSGGQNGSITWKSQFKDKLKKWRKICPY